MKFLKIFILTLALMIAAIFAINIPDRDLRPEVKEIVGIQGVPPEIEIPDSDNAYFAVLGFKAPKDEDITAAGHRVHAEYYTSVLKSDQGIPGTSIAILGPGPTFAKASDIPQCNPEEKGCLDYYREKKESIPQLLDDNKLLLERYGQLQNYSGYQDLMRYNPWSSWADLTSAIYAAHCLTAANASLQYDQGDRLQAMEMVASDIILWRKFLGGTADIAGKTYSFLALTRDYNLLAEMVSESARGLDTRKISYSVFAPLTESEKSYTLIIDGYMQALHRDFQQQQTPLTGEKIGFLAKSFFKENATINKAYDIFTSLKRTANIKPGQLDNELQILNEKIHKVKEKRLDMIYNPLGKMFLATSFDSDVVLQWNNMNHVLEEKINSLKNSVSNMPDGME